MIRPRRRWLTVVLSLLIFGAGFVAGGGTAVIVALRTVRENIQHPERAADRIADRLRDRLELTDEQAANVRNIVHRRQEALMAIRSQVQPRVMAELDQARDEIADVLDPQRKAQWLTLFADLRRQWMPPLPATSAPAR
jgi:cell division protein FtsB